VAARAIVPQRDTRQRAIVQQHDVARRAIGHDRDHHAVRRHDPQRIGRGHLDLPVADAVRRELLAELAMHCNATFGYQQWHIFDTTWAGRHPDLAQSLLRYANHWDPLDP